MNLSGSTVIAAASINNNLLAGTYFDGGLPETGQLTFGFVATGATGLTSGDIAISITCGGELIAENQMCRVVAGASVDAYPIIPDDFQLQGVCVAGEKLLIKVQNKDAAIAATLNWALILEPV